MGWLFCAAALSCKALPVRKMALHCQLPAPQCLSRTRRVRTHALTSPPQQSRSPLLPHITRDALYSYSMCHRVTGRVSHRCRSASAAQPVETASAATACPDEDQSGPPSEEDLARTWAYLKEFTVKNFRGLGAQYTGTPEARAQLRQQLQRAYHNPWTPAAWVPPRPTQHTAAPSQQTQPPQAPQEVLATPTATDSTQGRRTDAAAGQAEGPPPALVMIGLMASDVRVGARAMRDYCQALGLPLSKLQSRTHNEALLRARFGGTCWHGACKVPGVESVASIQGVVYIKYNSVSQVCYVSPYLGQERGVLLQLGHEQLGHFPLGLFDENMTNPPPEL